MRIPFTLFLIIILLSGRLEAQVATLEGRQWSQTGMDELITKKMEADHIPGVSLAIINGGAIVLNKSYGWRNIEMALPVDSNTTFEAASLSKPVFAYGFSKLVASGKIALDTPLYRYMDYPDISYDPRNQLVTARMILSHTAGFPNWRDGSRDGKLYFISDPGEKFAYSGEGYVYLGRVVEKIAGTPLNDYFRDSVFIPLSMSHTFYIWNAHADSVTSIGYSKKGKPMPKTHPGQVRVASGLQTNAGDYARMLCGILNAEGPLKETLDIFFQPQLKVKAGGIVADYWGLGFAIKMYKDKKLINHFGSNPGFESFMEIYPDTKYGVVMFANKDGGLDFMKELINKVFHDD